MENKSIIESVKKFIERKNKQFKNDKEKNKCVLMKDISREGKLVFKRESWKFIKQNNVKEKVFIIEKLVKDNSRGKITHHWQKGDIEYRIGYYIVGKIGKARGRWIWGQFCPIIPKEDLIKIIRELKKL